MSTSQRSPPDSASAAPAPALTLSWTDPGDRTITRYQFRHRSRPSGGGGFTVFSAWIDVPDSDATTTSYDHTRDAIISGTRYRYQIRAVNEAGEGPMSGSVDYVAP